MLYRNLVLTTLLACGLLPSAGQKPSQQMSNNDSKDETALVAVLKQSEPKRSGADATLLQALEKLKQMSLNKTLVSDETFSQLARFIDVETDGREQIWSNIDSHPAMAALYFAGAKTFPLLINILVSESQDSRRFELALWTMIHIEHMDSRRVYLLLMDTVHKTPYGRDHKQLLAAALKARELNLIPE
jgi:hypothetical protein